MNQASGRILVVDDDENNRDMLSRRLERNGYQVAVAPDGPQALELIAAQSFDLILLDIEMPRMHGFEVLRRLRETHPATELPVIIATAHGDRADVVEALRLGANDFVTKPLDFPVVLARSQTQLSIKFGVDRIRLLEADLRKRNAELEQHNQRMKQSLDLAARMQMALLPSGPVNFPGVTSAWLFHPCDEIGGDILDIFPLGPDHVGLYLLDVSGHGVPAALLSVTLSKMLAPNPGQPSLVEESTASGLHPRSPSAIAAILNRRFMMTAANNQYFTMFYAVLDVRNRKLTYVSAGHPPALVVPCSGGARFLDGRNFAVGWFDDPGFEDFSVELHENDRLFVYSDGVTETMNGFMAQFGGDRLTSACCGGQGMPLKSSLAALMNELTQFRDRTPVEDDISALAIEIKAEG